MHSVSMSTRGLLALLLAGLLAACAGTAQRPDAPVSDGGHYNLNATLWMQAAAEYRAALLGSFVQARQQLDAALADPGWDALPPAERAAIARRGFETLPPAIIADADETLIDNSPLQARNVLAGREFELDSWREWVAEARARALPGVAEFLRHADARGVRVYYVTNRDTPQEFEGTLANLRALGFPVDADGGNLMLRGDARAPAREKGERRRWIGERHRVLLMLGDNLGDFLDGIAVSPSERQALVDAHAGWWGTRWIMLPNPSYGSWEGAEQRLCAPAVRDDPVACRRSRLRTQ
jgi:5'-nucleotidase (lipoprotein e(P4) family)